MRKLSIFLRHADPYIFSAFALLALFVYALVIFMIFGIPQRTAAYMAGSAAGLAGLAIVRYRKKIF